MVNRLRCEIWDQKTFTIREISRDTAKVNVCFVIFGSFAANSSLWNNDSDGHSAVVYIIPVVNHRLNMMFQKDGGPLQQFCLSIS